MAEGREPRAEGGAAGGWGAPGHRSPRNELAWLPEPRPCPGDQAWPHRRQWLGALPLDPLLATEALDAVEALVESGRGGAVMLPCADHLVLAEGDEALRQALEGAELSLGDGQRLVWAAETLGQPLPEDVPAGALLGPLLALAGRRRWRVFLLGEGADGLEATAARLEQRHGARVVGVHAHDTPEASVRAILRASPHLVLCALPSPAQELLLHQIKERLRPALLLGVGAALDPGTGQRAGAPRLFRRLGLGWLFRLLAGPRRLGRRGLRRDARFLWVFWRLLWGRGRRAPAATDFR
jgi:N-acetylglucosaminyldiphosphoundecaprenol N-acetyl-beta-D-mannosaminyltransferase